jgi:hypothetical protein
LHHCYHCSVTSNTVRDFCGVMSGRVDKDLLITSGTFTAEATKEATREGVPLIDLIGGDALCDALKEYGLGVQTEKVGLETVTVDGLFFSGSGCATLTTGGRTGARSEAGGALRQGVDPSTPERLGRACGRCSP